MSHCILAFMYVAFMHPYIYLVNLFMLSIPSLLSVVFSSYRWALHYILFNLNLQPQLTSEQTIKIYTYLTSATNKIARKLQNEIFTISTFNMTWRQTWRQYGVKYSSLSFEHVPILQKIKTKKRGQGNRLFSKQLLLSYKQGISTEYWVPLRYISW